MACTMYKDVIHERPLFNTKSFVLMFISEGPPKVTTISWLACTLTTPNLQRKQQSQERGSPCYFASSKSDQIFFMTLCYYLFPPMSLVLVHLLCQKLFHPRRDRKRESQVSVILCESKSESHVLLKFFHVGQDWWREYQIAKVKVTANANLEAIMKLKAKNRWFNHQNKDQDGFWKPSDLQSLCLVISRNILPLMFKKDFLEKFSSQPLPSVRSPKKKLEWSSC